MTKKIHDEETIWILNRISTVSCQALLELQCLHLRCREFVHPGFFSPTSIKTLKNIAFKYHVGRWVFWPPFKLDTVGEDPSHSYSRPAV